MPNMTVKEARALIEAADRVAVETNIGASQMLVHVTKKAALQLVRITARMEGLDDDSVFGWYNYLRFSTDGLLAITSALPE